MPSKTKLKNAAIAARSAALPSIPKELLDQFVSGPMTGAEVNAASMALEREGAACKVKLFDFMTAIHNIKKAKKYLMDRFWLK